MKDYTGETIYLGIDVHKSTYSVTAISQNQIAKRDRLVADPALLIEYCKRHFQGAEIYSAYEAGFCGFHLHRVMTKNGFRNIVVHPASIEISARDRVKTDKRDSLKIATQLSVGRLKGIYVPSEEREGYRAITRMRDQFIQDRTRLGVRIKSLLHMHGLIKHDDNKRTSRRWVEGLLALEFQSDIDYCIHKMARQWLEIADTVKDIENELKKQAIIDVAAERIYLSAPGIGPTSARILANELGDMSQFSNEKQLFSYTGLTPQEHSSGEHNRLGHITRQGKSSLRKILVQAAWVAIKQDPTMNEVFVRISKNAGGKKAIVGVARRLIGHIRACFKRGELYSGKERTESSIA